MIETPEGLENVDAIAAVDGVDVIHVGSNDLLTAMGKPGTYGSPEHLAALDRVFAAPKKHGKVAGVGGDRNVQRQMDSITQRRAVPHDQQRHRVHDGGSDARDGRAATRAGGDMTRLRGLHRASRAALRARR